MYSATTHIRVRYGETDQMGYLYYGYYALYYEVGRAESIRELGFTYEMDARTGADHYQQICPRCRRALFGLAQGAMWRDPTDGHDSAPPA